MQSKLQMLMLLNPLGTVGGICRPLNFALRDGRRHLSPSYKVFKNAVYFD